MISPKIRAVFHSTCTVDAFKTISKFYPMYTDGIISMAFADSIFIPDPKVPA